MTDLWSVETIEQGPRYQLPKAALKYREKLRGHEKLALDEMVKLFRKSPGKPVTVTSRQFAKLCGVSTATAARSINKLIDAGFIALIAKGTYEGKRLPSRYRLTMFECNGKEPTHDYIDDPLEWRRQRPNGRPSVEKPKPMTKLVVSNVPMDMAPALAEVVAEALSDRAA
jgi:hypothetical protein